MNIYPSLMVVDEVDLKKEIELLQVESAGFHIDVMDNTFVPNVTYTSEQVNKMINWIKNPWIHLMIDDPKAFYQQLFLPIHSLVSFHIELDIDIADLIKSIKEKKHRVSLAMRPKTSLEQAIPFFNIVDQILIMSVEPGFSGQHFLESSFEKIAALVALRKKNNAHFRIGVDGGIDRDKVTRLVELGVDDCAIATAIFKNENHIAALQELKKLAKI
jgi:ribulose-phosphate 3-epimerase